MRPRYFSKLSTTLGALFAVSLLVAACDDGESTTPDTTAPSVATTVPADADTAVALNGNIAVTFSEEMDPSTISDATFTLKQGADAISGKVTYTGVTASFEPNEVLTAGTVYNGNVAVGAKDLAGNALEAAFAWSFTTGTTLDTEAPTVLSTLPAAAAVNVSSSGSLSAEFSEAMNPTSLSATTFTVTGPGVTAVAGIVTYAGMTVTFEPSADLALDTLFTASIAASAEDLAGNALAVDFSWTFTTSATVTLGPAPVILGLAGDYAILAKSGVDTVPASAVIGNIGVSPIDSTGITGFSLSVDASNEFSTSTQVTGKVRAPDYSPPTPASLTTAVSNMETAYTDAVGRTTPDYTELGAGEIGGLTLAPGLYKWGTGLSISTDVILAGGPNDVWIFQIAGDVTQANGIKVTLSGGALPKNIFWQAFGQVMIGTTAHMEGIVLCQTAVILGTGASVNGRLLAQTSVTLDQSTVTQPAL